jgi:hypothetical protein
MKWFVLSAVGAIAGHLLGWVLAVCWAFFSNNLMMPEPEYEKKRASILLTTWAIVGCSTILGGLLAAFVTKGQSHDPSTHSQDTTPG